MPKVGKARILVRLCCDHNDVNILLRRHHTTPHGFFDKDQLTRELQNGPVTFTVVGTLPNGQVFHGSDTVRIRGKNEDR